MAEPRRAAASTPNPLTRVWRFATSLRLGIILLALLAAASVVGIWLPQPESFRRADYLSARLSPRSAKAVTGEEFAALARAAGILGPRDTAEGLLEKAQHGQLTELETLRLSYVDSYGLLGRVLLGLRFHVLFRSFLFRALCVLLIVNLVACSLHRLPGQWRAGFGTPPGTEPRWYERRSIHGSLAAGADPAAAVAEVERSLRMRGFRSHRRDAAAHTTLDASRGLLGPLGRLGSQAVHLGVVLVVLGGFVSGVLSFRHDQVAAPGDVIRVPRVSPWPWHKAETERAARADWRRDSSGFSLPAAFRVRLDRFDVRFDTTGKPEHYGAHVTVLDTEPPIEHVVEVNRPLIYRGFYAYQQSYQTDPSRLGSVSFVLARVRRKGEVSHDFHGQAPDVEVLDRVQVAVEPGVPVTVPGTSLTVRVLQYFPHWIAPFETGPDGKRVMGEPRNASNEPQNPAVLVRLEGEGQETQEGWFFLPFRPGEPRRAADYGDFRIFPTDYQPAYNTVLEFKTHPVLWPVWLGCGVMMAGVVLCFYFNHERIWVLVRARGDGGSEIWLAGNAFKWRESFQDRFTSLVAALGEREERNP